jgi:hypothetical protein
MRLVWWLSLWVSIAAWPVLAIDNTTVGNARDTWLDPVDPLFAPRAGQRFEMSFFLGGEAALATLQPNKLPDFGGISFTGVFRYYPVDRLAVTFAVRGYTGIDGIPAAGTATASVASLFAGIRYDLLRERRFSLAVDFFSGPSVFAFSEVIDLQSPTRLIPAIGGEMGTAMVMRYSFGPVVAELRGLVGGRAGSDSNPNANDFGGGPFSALFIGGDVGISLVSTRIADPPKVTLPPLLPVGL